MPLKVPKNQILGFFDDYRDTKETIFGLPVFGRIDALNSYCRE